ncbi:hypothetical protein [Aerococcus urinae]|uniref:hypothetical protein n=1 Tax=Aerococcus urinae TaxID=1376 RepID=UPI000DCF1ECF|nr:hypothetical protein [Aerococcus urinae]MDK6370872.1 hypothetical protein [Aerococcus urinae]MDK6597243.1 hypothetical protein [Aerococcus urinae]RAV72717.1 hypothetical protein DBT40_00795 [Aerococcus urinae]RAW05450.1 hypothetical protein DBT41_00790 [Aerococcus urinae]
MTRKSETLEEKGVKILTENLSPFSEVEFTFVTELNLKSATSASERQDHWSEKSKEFTQRIRRHFVKWTLASRLEHV